MLRRCVTAEKTASGMKSLKTGLGAHARLTTLQDTKHMEDIIASLILPCIRHRQPSAMLPEITALRMISAIIKLADEMTSGQQSRVLDLLRHSSHFGLPRPRPRKNRPCRTAMKAVKKTWSTAHPAT